MKKSILWFLLSITSIFIKAQTRFQGYVYTFQNDRKDFFQYTISTAFKDGVYQTVYKIYSPITGKPRFTVTASHFKEDRKVVVKVQDEEYLLSVVNNEQETSYEQPSLELFGERGAIGMLAKSAPNQLTVQFMSNRFDFVRVLTFLGSYEDNIFQYFIFNKNDKIAEARISDNNKIDKGIMAKYLPEPNEILRYSYITLIDSLTKNHVAYKKDSSFAEDEFIGYVLRTNNGEYFLLKNNSISSYTFQVPVRFEELHEYYLQKGARVKSHDQGYYALFYKSFVIELRNMGDGKTFVTYNKL